MRKKRIICGAVAAALTLSVAVSGCSLVSTNVNADYNQVVATVNISGSEEFEKEFKDAFGTSYEAYKNGYGSTDIIKRELITYFINVGYSLMQQGSFSTYEDMFNYGLNSLVNTAILTQYSTTYLLKDMMTENADAVTEYLAKETEAERLEYLLGGEDSEEVKLAKYSLMVSLNNWIDVYENRIKDKGNDDDTTTSSETQRAVPGNVGTVVEDYLPLKKNSGGALVDKDGNVLTDESKSVIDYNVYTGYNGYLLSQSGIYQEDAIDGTFRSRRVKAYEDYMGYLEAYNLVDKKKENLKDVLSLEYTQKEYVSQLKSRVINKYIENFEDKREEELKANDYAYVKSKYEKLIGKQRDDYADAESFAADFGNLSDSNFLLYAPKTEDDESTFGFVYNILLQFDGIQQSKRSAYQNTAVYKDEEVDSGYNDGYYKKRNDLLKNVKVTDQRKTWFTGSTDYAFEAEGEYFYNGHAVTASDTTHDWLFFEDNLKKNDRYESIDKYIGKYAYNGVVTKTEDDKYIFQSANSLTIDQMLNEFSAYINYVLGTDGNVKFGDGASTTWNTNAEYYNTSGNDFYKNGGALNNDGVKEVDYSKFLYASGSVNLGLNAGTAEFENRANLFNKDSTQYKVMSAVNELQYAYTMDPSVLSQYVGYTVEHGDTSYIKEFEYCAKEAIGRGAGSFAVCAGDYGWHLIYVTYTFSTKGDDDGSQFTPDWTNIETEGTFENLFFESIKNKDIAGISTTRRTQIVTKYNLEKTVTKHEDRYKDLLELDQQ